MPETMPQEIAVWYVIPSLRKELAKQMLKSRGLTQKSVASILGITEPAISQYLSDKRASEIKFSPKAMADIRKAAELILKEPKNARVYIYRLSNLLMKTKEACRLHMALDGTVKRGCKLCFE
jgi:uncharacterized protein